MRLSWTRCGKPLAGGIGSGRRAIQERIVVAAVALDYGSDMATGKDDRCVRGVRYTKGTTRQMAKFALIVTFGDKSKRDETRPAHREHLKGLFDRGKLVASGPFVDDEGALIIYECADEAEARSLLAADPYSQADGVIAEVQIRGWNRVFPPA